MVYRGDDLKRVIILIPILVVFAVGICIPAGTIGHNVADEIALQEAVIHSEDGNSQTITFADSLDGLGDDVLHYMDSEKKAFAITSDWNDTLWERDGQSAPYNTTTLDYTEIQDDGNYYHFYCAGTDSSAYWVTFNITAPMLNNLELNYDVYTRQGLDGSDPDETTIYLYNFILEDWDAFVTLDDWDWNDGSISNIDTDYIKSDDRTVFVMFLGEAGGGSITIEWKFDYLVIENTDSGYAESFADGSNWADHSNFAHASDTIASDGDIMTKSNNWGGGTDYDYVYDDSMSVDVSSGSWYIEFSCSSTNLDTQRVYIRDADGEASGSYQVFDVIESSTLTPYKFLITAVTTVEQITLVAYDNDGDSTEEWDYIRIAPSDEMGLGHDCSTTEGLTPSTGETVSSDGDVATLTGTDASYASLTIDVDTTATVSSINPVDYPVCEIVYKGDGLQFYSYDESSTISTKVTLPTAADWTIARYNLKELNDGGGNYVSKFGIKDNTDNTQYIALDSLTVFGIANWTVTLAGSTMGTDDYVYVDAGALQVVMDEPSATGAIKLSYDPAISVSDTYSVWNLSLDESNPSSSLDYRFYLYASTWSYFDDTTRGATPSGAITDMEIRFYESDNALSSIKFIEDSTAPVIQEKWNAPNDPTSADSVSIECVITDAVYIYEVTASPLSQPSGSALSTQTLTVIDVNPSLAELWGVSLSNLDPGEYVWEIYASDGANGAYSYLSFYVSESFTTTYIRLHNLRGDFIPFERFDVYLNGTLQPEPVFEGDESKSYNITVVDPWDVTVNSTIFTWEKVMRVVIPVYTFKVTSWFEGFCYFNMTKAGFTIYEPVMPLETVPWLLYEGTYSWIVDYRNGSTVSGNLNLVNSTALIITGSTIADIAGLSNSILDMTTDINVTVISTNNQVITISLDLTNINTTISSQLVQILLNVTNSNSTIYSQGLEILTALSNTGLLYNQTVSILSQITNINTTILNAIVDLSSELSLVNSSLSTQYISISSALLAIDSSLASNFTYLLANMTAIGANITSNHITIAAILTAISSNITTNQLNLIAVLNAIDSSISASEINVIAAIGNIPIFRGITIQEMADLLALSIGVEWLDLDADGRPDGTDGTLIDKIPEPQNDLPFWVVIIVILLIILGFVIKLGRDLAPKVFKMIKNSRKLNVQLANQQ